MAKIANQYKSLSQENGNVCFTFSSIIVILKITWIDKCINFIKRLLYQRFQLSKQFTSFQNFDSIVIVRNSAYLSRIKALKLIISDAPFRPVDTAISLVENGRSVYYKISVDIIHRNRVRRVRKGPIVQVLLIYIHTCTRES